MSTRPPAKAILFDIGGPLDTEIIYERLIDDHIREALASEGIAVSDAEYAAANDFAVASFAPNAYQAIIWRLCRHDYDVSLRVYEAMAARSAERHEARGGFELRDGVLDMLDRAPRTQDSARPCGEPARRCHRAHGARRHRTLLPPSRRLRHARLPQARCPRLPRSLQGAACTARRMHHGRRPHRQRHRAGERARHADRALPHRPPRRPAAALMG